MARLLLYLLLASCVNVRCTRNVNKNVEIYIFPFRKAYGNPFHPEDDELMDGFVSDEDGDNLHGSRLGQLSDSEKKIVKVKRLKVNGRYFDMSIAKKNPDLLSSAEAIKEKED